MAITNNKVYYGEYSLKRWVDLILNGNITLPPYQRYFVWQESQVLKLIKSIKEGYYLPAVTIGNSKNPLTNKKENMVLDGQQRLTSILLAYLGKFPKRRTPSVKRFADENDHPESETEDGTMSEWTFKELQDMGKTRTAILDEIKQNHANNYIDFSIPDIKITEAFLSKHFIQFAYIVPDTTATEVEKSRFFTNVFHSINKEGTKLTPQESRLALYYQGGNHKDKLEPEFCKSITVKTSPMDFVRFLALMSNYKKVGHDKVAYGYSSVGRREALYEDFVYAFVGDGFSNNDTFELDKSRYEARLASFENALADLGLDTRKCKNIVELDYVYAGLVYYIIIEGKDCDKSKWHGVQSKLSLLHEGATEEHRHTPGMLKFLRDRLHVSVETYNEMFA